MFRVNTYTYGPVLEGYLPASTTIVSLLWWLVELVDLPSRFEHVDYRRCVFWTVYSSYNNAETDDRCYLGGISYELTLLMN